jgi:hypothetical protein
MPIPVLNALRNAHDGFDVAYYLGTHRSEAKQILDEWNRGNYQWVANQMDFISNGLRFNGGQVRERNQPRSAPRPINPLSGGSTYSGVSQDPSTMSMKDYKAWRNSGGGRR